MAAGVPSFLIVGTPRSGTTLVQRIACELPDVAIPPETHFFEYFVSGLIRRRRFPLDARAIYDEVARFAALPTSAGMSIEPARVAVALDGVCHSPLQLFGALVRHLGGDAAVWGEKTPLHLLWWRRLAEASPRLRFIVVVRNPLSVIASWRRAWNDEPYVVTAQRWLSDQDEATALAAVLGSARVLTLRYEDVVADHFRTRAAVASFLGMTAADRPPASVERPLFLPWETWKERALRDISRERVDAWRTELTPPEAAEIVRICAPRMAAFGYETPPLAGGSDAMRRSMTSLRRAHFMVKRRMSMARIATTSLT